MALRALACLTSAPPAPWPSDRSGTGPYRPRLFSPARLPRGRDESPQVPGLNTMATTTRTRTARSIREIAMILRIRAWTSGSAAV